MPNIKFTGDDEKRGSAIINMPSPNAGNERFDSHMSRSGYSSSTLAMPMPDIPSAMQDDFNWDQASDDGDDADDKDEGAKQVRGFWRLHPLLRSLLIMLGGGIILVIPVIAVLASHPDLPFRSSIDSNSDTHQRDYNLQCVARSFALLAAIWVSGVLIYHLVDLIPDGVIRVWRVFKGKRGLEKLKDRLQLFVAIKLYIKLVVNSAMSLVCFVIMFPNASYRLTGAIEKGNSSWDQVLFQINVLIFFACVIFALEKLALKITATRFHRSAYKERIDQQTYASWVLDHLNRSRDGHTSAKNTPYMEASTATFPGDDAVNSRKDLVPKGGPYGDDAARSISELNTPPALKEQRTSSFWRNTFSSSRPKHGKKPSKSIVSRLWNIRDMAMDGGIDMNSNQYASRLARKLFDALHGDRDYLIVDDFLPFFEKEEDTIKAFEFFDKDNNGDISKREMRDRVILIYKERRQLLAALSDMSQVVGKLDLVLMGFASVAIIIIALMVFGLDALKSLATLGTLLLGWSFVFGGSMKNVLDCIIFLFQVHPYDVGDTVVIATESLTVFKLRLLSTVFFKTDGTYTIYPNVQLASMKIQNLRRSNPQSESIPVAFDFDTPTNKIYALHDRMNAFAEENSRDFVVPVGFNVDLLENSNRIQISVGINYKSNWQDGGKRYDAKTRFAFALRQAITDLGLRYAMPLQPVAMVAPPPGYDDAPNVECERPNEVHSDDDDIFGPQSGNMSRGEFRNVQQGPHGTHNGTGDSGNNSGVPTSAVAGVMLANEL
ncbi:hypothetical protein LPJ62_001669 [Coemansia sp. RSA 2167]|nr:hypothetical protein LPJ58_000631 [Coemansia sp. RSA 1591]KAJ1767048.1 hypothetical protein LPJ69_000635 [Coemansia sp. RSA 1752]KAJ1776609.1 hypothetical protein LPJ54_002959 [Coemansia sp. RSA 1824]KAJ1790950.1 hypothetical protein LPJ62_001669 [Coemansia sp. RSA 2167]KAJ1794746.1 hypothetical protein LPJ67_000519 [Coemansia sp. RSA 1938]KAJ2153067.1 hypothetical protein J3F82_002241 [Coemansia sp. RSA 637]KAJ2246117.1 hypothetical protein GGH97_002597 [Coemansia sp. RSA 475]KAJ2256070.